jgi:hypothetical protein
MTETEINRVADGARHAVLAVLDAVPLPREDVIIVVRNVLCELLKAKDAAAIEYHSRRLRAHALDGLAERLTGREAAVARARALRAWRKAKMKPAGSPVEVACRQRAKTASAAGD